MLSANKYIGIFIGGWCWGAILGNKLIHALYGAIISIIMVIWAERLERRRKK